MVHRPMIYRNAPPWSWQCPPRGYYNLWICHEGSARLEHADKGYTITAWTALLIPPQESITALSTSESPSLINSAFHWVPEKKEYGLPFMYLNLRETDTANALIQGILRVSVFNDTLASQRSVAMLTALLALVYREWQIPWESSADSIISAQIERINSGSDLFASVRDLASETGLSHVHYVRRFKRLAQTTPAAFIVRQRTERARTLLRETDWTLEHIAHELGYSDHFYFSRQFRQVMGETPGHYRKKYALRSC